MTQKKLLGLAAIGLIILMPISAQKRKMSATQRRSLNEKTNQSAQTVASLRSKIVKALRNTLSLQEVSQLIADIKQETGRVNQLSQELTRAGLPGQAKNVTSNWNNVARDIDKLNQLQATLQQAHRSAEKKPPVAPRVEKKEAARHTSRDRLLTDLERIARTTLESFSLANPVSSSDQAIRSQQIYQIAPQELAVTVQKLALRNAKIPLQGEFSQAAQSDLLDWIERVHRQKQGTKSEYLQQAIGHIDKLFQSDQQLAPSIQAIDERAARILFLARLIKDRIYSLIEGAELD